MRDKKAEAWIIKNEEEKAETSKPPAVPETTTSGSTAPVPAAKPDSVPQIQNDTSPLDEEDEVELIASEAVDEDEGDTDQIVHTTTETPAPVIVPSSDEIPKFQSAGTVIIRAMQSLPATGEDGWLEEGSVVCFADGRVLGTVSQIIRAKLTIGL
jgi:H/ACA ribonucleoprotein complex non-core subunit NAF1